MTYPKVSTDPPTSTPAPPCGVPASPRFPRDRGAGPGLLGRRTAPSRRRSSTATPGEDGANEFVFYDGPPFANGLPHYGHLLTGYVKDLVPRYQTMRGRRVERRFGWDTHGLPAELEAMRQLGIKTKDEILELGIEKFNAACRESVLKYTDEWRDYVTRQARWVDFDHDYKTLEPRLHGVGDLGVQAAATTRAWSTRASACCPTAGTTRRRCPTTSCGWTTTSTRTARTRRSPSGCRLETGELAAGLDDDAVDPARPTSAIMVGPDIDYVVVESDVTGTRRALRPRRGAARRLRPGARASDDRPSRVVERLKGADLRRPRATPRRSPTTRATAQGATSVVSRPTTSPPTDGTGLVHTRRRLR